MQKCEQFSKELKEYPVVARAPANFFLSGEHAVMFGMPALCQPVSLYAYAGIRKTKDGGIKVLKRNGQAGLYRANPDKLEEIEFDVFKPVNAVDDIEGVLSEEFPQKNAEVCLYLTAPSGCGLATSGAVGATLSLALQWLFSSKEDRKKTQKVTEDLNNHNRSLSELVQTDIFQRIYRLAWKIDSIFHDYKSSGVNAFTSLVGSPHGLPIIYQGDLREGLYDRSKMANTETKPLSAKDSVGEVHFELYDQLDFFAKDIHEIEPNADARTFPLVVSIMYSGIEKQTGLAIRAAEISTNEVEASNMIQLKKVKDFSRTDIMLLLGICSQKMIHAIIMFFRGERERMTEVMNTTQTIQNVLRDFVGVSTAQIEEICMVAGAHGFSAKLTGGGTGGDVVILSSLEKIAELNDCLKKLKNRGFSSHLCVTRWSNRKGALKTTPAKLVNDEAYYLLLFFDVVDSTGREEQVDKYFEEVRKECQEANGNFLQRIGDEGRVSFPTSEDSLEYGKNLIATARNLGLEIKVGIHSGHENWPVGIAVPDEGSLSMGVAAQCQKLAESSAIVICENVMDELPLEKQNEFRDHIVIKKKNLEIRTYIWEQNR